MALYIDLEEIRSRLFTFVDSLWACTSADITEENIEKLLMEPAITTSSLFTSKVHFEDFYPAIDEINFLIDRFNNRIDSGEVIPCEGFPRLLKFINSCTTDVRFISFSVIDHIKAEEFPPEHGVKFDLVKNKYVGFIEKLNECIIKYNNRHTPIQSLKSLFSTNVSPLKESELLP
jgi:hypothetical protein